MAELKTYRCQDCGYTIHAESTGYYCLMSGLYINFSCHNCKEIVSIPAESFQKYSVGTCPRCGAHGRHLFLWNPIEGLCPKCGGHMQEDYFEGIIMAD